jgi:hypothetical protein
MFGCLMTTRFMGAALRVGVVGAMSNIFGAIIIVLLVWFICGIGDGNKSE